MKKLTCEWGLSDAQVLSENTVRIVHALLRICSFKPRSSVPVRSDVASAASSASSLRARAGVTRECAPLLQCSSSILSTDCEVGNSPMAPTCVFAALAESGEGDLRGETLS